MQSVESRFAKLCTPPRREAYFGKNGAFFTKKIQNLQKEGVQTIAKTKK